MSAIFQPVCALKSEGDACHRGGNNIKVLSIPSEGNLQPRRCLYRNARSTSSSTCHCVIQPCGLAGRCKMTYENRFIQSSYPFTNPPLSSSFASHVATSLPFISVRTPRLSPPSLARGNSFHLFWDSHPAMLSPRFCLAIASHFVSRNTRFSICLLPFRTHLSYLAIYLLSHLATYIVSQLAFAPPLVFLSFHLTSHLGTLTCLSHPMK